jgi:hypothetical protein
MSRATLENSCISVEGILGTLVFPGPVFTFMPVLELTDQDQDDDQGKEEYCKDGTQNGRARGMIIMLNLIFVDFCSQFQINILRASFAPIFFQQKITKPKM